MNKTVLGCAVVVGGCLLLLGLFAFGSYNSLVNLDEGVKSAWSQVENVYQRRADLVPNLVATVKGASDFERETLESVVNARAKVGQVNFNGPPSAEQMQQFQSAQDGLSSALSRLLVVVERYPELTATQGYRDLQVQLEGTENRIAVERRNFNQAAQAYNSKRRRFPSNFVANMAGFEERAYFAATPGAEEAPKVSF
ncbi:MAG: LemA family protein [Acidobacteria bacterium]|nr:LemA family protein [Acidobacteriota bacterium]